MGLSYRHLGRFDEALKYFQEGLKLDPHNASCLLNVGFIEERQGNHARAEQMLQQALRSNPDLPDALLELANLRITDKKFEEAAELSSEICESEPRSRYRLLQARHGGKKPPPDCGCAARLECLPNPLEECFNRAVSLPAPFRLSRQPFYPYSSTAHCSSTSPNCWSEIQKHPGPAARPISARRNLSETRKPSTSPANDRTA